LPAEHLHEWKLLMKYILFVALLFSLFVSQAQQMSSGGKLHPLQAIMDIRHYTIALEVDMQQQAISGYTEVDLLLNQTTDTLLLDLVNQFTITKITVNNQTVSFIHQNNRIFITQPGGFAKGKQTVKVVYAGSPAVAVKPPWQGGFSWSKDSKGKPWLAINCQFEGGKIYYVCKDHPSDEPDDGVDFMITVPKGLVVAGPGLLQKVTQQKNNTVTYHWKTRYPISNYCTLFNIGNYKVVSREYTSINGNIVPVQFYVLEQDTAHAKEVIDIRIRDTRILEKYFGEYPWIKEKIGIAQVANSGMEHQTMITFGGNFTFATVGGQPYSANLYHEFAHEWWANKVTNKDWAHMWIQEGIATYAEALGYRDLAGEDAYQELIFKHWTRIKNEKPLVQGKEINSVDTYSSDLYFKGSFFMHSLRYLMGDSLFFPTLKKLSTDPRYTYHNLVITEDVEELFSRESGRNLQPLFDLYLRTTQKLDFMVKQTQLNSYQIKLQNLSMPLPVDITTSAGTQRLIVTGEGLLLKSTTPPIIDAKGFYFKKVTWE
jgi:aminopeptidase N